MAPRNKSGNQPIEMIETTIGELIEIITEIAVEGGKSEAEGYHLASVTLEHIIRRNLASGDERKAH